MFERIRTANLKLNPDKCELFQTKVKFLVHIVSSEGISNDTEKVEAVKEWPIPTHIKQVRSFQGLCSYYRKFIHNFYHIARPLNRLLEKGILFHWSEECDQAFQILKHKLVEAPILGYPQENDTCCFILDTGASNFGIGGVLTQIQNVHERVIGYYSKSFNKAERSYCVTRKELLALVQSVKHFHCYLYGRSFTLRTDHGYLRWLNNFRNPVGKLARWLEVLSEYDFVKKHRRGRSLLNADALSRRPCS